MYVCVVMSGFGCDCVAVWLRGCMFMGVYACVWVCNGVMSIIISIIISIILISISSLAGCKKFCSSRFSFCSGDDILLLADELDVTSFAAPDFHFAVAMTSYCSLISSM